jgi:hypothetical protein
MCKSQATEGCQRCTPVRMCKQQANKVCQLITRHKATEVCQLIGSVRTTRSVRIITFLIAFLLWFGTAGLRPVSADSKVSGLTPDYVPQGTDLVMSVDTGDTAYATTGTNKKVLFSDIPRGFSRVDSISGGSVFYIPQEITDNTYKLGGVTLSGASTYGRTWVLSCVTKPQVWLPIPTSAVSNQWVELLVNGTGGLTIYATGTGKYIDRSATIAGSSLWTVNLSGATRPALVRLRVDPSGTTWVPEVKVPSTGVWGW